MGSPDEKAPVAAAKKPLAKKIELAFEWLIWRSRLVVLLAVIFGILSSLGLFAMASFDLAKLFIQTPISKLEGTAPPELRAEVIANVVEGIDVYLVGAMLIIISLGMYEIFIHQIDEAEDCEIGKRLLAIHTLDELKDKMAKMVMLVLVIKFFSKFLHLKKESAQEPIDILYLAVGIFLVAAAIYLSHLSHSKNSDEEKLAPKKELESHS